MRLDRLLGSAIALAGCATPADQNDTGEATAYVGTADVIPPDATCTHIIATRLADFHVSQYQGVLAGASFEVATGETRVTATAYPLPCNAEPAAPPWIADDQLVTFVGGPNTLTLHFHQNDSVVIDPIFDDTNAAEAVLRGGSSVRTGRNGEGASGPDLSLDGWEVRRIALPPAAPSETVVFSMEGKGGLTQTPRDIAAMLDGRIIAQEFATFEPLRVFDAAGTFVESLPVVYPDGTIVWDGTDGLEAIDATHLVRTGFLNNGIDCDVNGVCTNSGIEILELITAGDGTHQARVAQQIRTPAAFAGQYVVGVTPVGARFALSILPNEGTGSQIVLIDAAGTIVAGPTVLPGDVEGLFQTGDGRLAGVDYHGHVTMLDANTLAPRVGETATYLEAVDLSLPGRLVWDTVTGDFVALGDGPRLVHAPASFTTATNLPIDLSGYVLVSGLGFRGDTNQILLADRLPPVNAGQRIPTVDAYDGVTGVKGATITLQGVSLPARTISIAYVGAHQQVASHYRRPGGTADATLDAVVFIHDVDGTLATRFDLAPFGFTRVQSVAYLATTDEILVAAIDEFGTGRYVVTSPAGPPKRSYRVDNVGGLGAMGPITSGPSAGDVGVVFAEPSRYEQIQLP